MTKEELQIDRMVDGELSQDEQRDLLLDCESNNRWRELALAYVESQAFGSALRSPQFFAETPSLKTVPQTVVLEEPMRHTVERERSKKDQLTWNVMSLAAAVLLSLGLGYGLGWWWQGDAGPASVDLAGNNQTVGGSNDAIVGSVPDSRLKTMPFTVSDPASDELRQVDLPVVNASELGPNWEQQLTKRDVPDDMLRELRDHGLNVRQARTFTRIRLPDGRLVVVPIDYFFEQPFQ